MTLVFLLLATGVRADEIRVAVAANFRPCLDVLAAEFEASTSHEIVIASGSTGRHYAQITAGAPFDIFLAADSRRPRELESSGHTIPGSRFCYARGVLILWWPAPPTPAPISLRDALTSSRLKHLAVANPRLAPYGEAAREALQALDLWDSLAPRLVQGQSVGQAWQFVASGNAQAGLVARCQLHDRPDGLVLEIPRSLHAPIVQEAVLLADAEHPAAAREFLAFLRGSLARAVIADFGYELPDANGS
jgi:molybdate transport system substrate-binding protein